MMLTERLDTVFARHQRLAAACRAAVNAWGLEIQCQDQDCYPPVLTCIATPGGYGC